MSISTSRRLFTVAEYDRMIQAGVFEEDDRLELIEGEILTMSPIGSRHAACVRRLQRLLTQQLETHVVVDVHNPLLLNDRSEPQPDIMLLKDRPDLYETEHPRPDDVLLVVAVTDTSLAYDREIKIPAYGNSRITEVWIVDVFAGSIEVYRSPSISGYEEITIRRGTDLISSLSFPNLRIQVDRIVG